MEYLTNLVRIITLAPNLLSQGAGGFQGNLFSVGGSVMTQKSFIFTRRLLMSVSVALSLLLVFIMENQLYISG